MLVMVSFLCYHRFEKYAQLIFPTGTANSHPHHLLTKLEPLLPSRLDRAALFENLVPVDVRVLLWGKVVVSSESVGALLCIN